MRIIVPFLGKTREQYLVAGIEDFAGRLQRFAELSLPLLKEKKRPAKENPTRFALEDGQILRASVPATARMVALTPEGEQLSSEGLAGLLGRWEDCGIREVAFLIGGPCGLPPELVREADFALSLSRMTFTHEMARLLLLEQLYRAFSIRAGTGYHK